MQKPIRTLLLTLLAAASHSLWAEPVGYSINSDSGSDDSDGLYRIDLATGTEIERIGTVQSVLLNARIDVEGLAFAPDNSLYGIDDESLRLFRIDLGNALVDPTRDWAIDGLSSGNNDFGMTFACDGNLYVTSVTEQSLYRVETAGPDAGKAHIIGAPRSLGSNISAIAAYGNPVRLYGLGNGTAGENANAAAKLYEIDIADGTVTEIGPLGGSADSYAEGGLAFDADGQLWAITDRRPVLQPSQVMRINTTTGAASDVRTTSEEGFESLAIDVPRGCEVVGSGEHAAFVVQKRFEDGNDVTPVKLNIQCNTGLPLQQSLTAFPNEGPFGGYEVRFIVEEFVDGTLDCEVWEDAPAGYTGEYDCQSNSSCDTAGGAGPCSFTGVGVGEENLCLIHNRVNPVDFTVTKEWVYTREELEIEESSRIEFICDSVFGGDGTDLGRGQMLWSWVFNGNGASHTAKLYPDFGGSTRCRTLELPGTSASEYQSECAEPVPVAIGESGRICRVVNTVFFEGIPTLGQYGIMLFSALMLLTGLAAVRRSV